MAAMAARLKRVGGKAINRVGRDGDYATAHQESAA